MVKKKSNQEELSGVDKIKNTFIDFQKYLYESVAV